MPVGTAQVVAGILAERAPGGRDFAIISNLEFLHEGRVLRDVFHPDRVVLRGDNADALETLSALYEPPGASMRRSDRPSAKLIKYAANAVGATIFPLSTTSRAFERLGQMLR